MRSISRVADVSINTVSALLVDAGKACAAYHDATVRGVKARRHPGGRNLGLLLHQAEKRCDREVGPGRCR